MRPEAIELGIELNFECITHVGGLRRFEFPGLNYIRAETLTAQLSKSSTGVCSVPSGHNALLLNFHGTLMGRSMPGGKLVLAPPRSVTFIRNSRVIVQAARGNHEILAISWPSPVAGLLESWFNSKSGGKVTGNPRNLACRPIDPLFGEAVRRLEAALAGPTEVVEPLVAAFIFEVVPRLMQLPDMVQFATVPDDLQETIQDLIRAVRQSPATPWPLKDAADMAGYSPFHFSRVFKSLVGYGFHEFVDRCRTEAAVEMLLSTENPVDIVANACGFGTTQGLRESVKEYLGLVPSELRSLPEMLEYPH